MSAPASPVRQLSSYANADSRPPDGRDDGIDDTTAVTRALADGPGVVQIGPGNYRWGGVQVPPGVAVVGCGSSTLVRSNGQKQVFSQHGASGWAIRDLVLDGEADGDWRERPDCGECGMVVDGCWGYEIAGVTLRNFRGAGLRITRTDLGACGWAAGGNLDRVTACGNRVGVCLDFRAEYVNATELSCFNNVVGCLIHGGNCKIAASNFGANTCGIWVEDRENGSHGSIANCLVNHNEQYALVARNVENGMAIDACCFFYGWIQVENSRGVNITSGIIGCSVETDACGVNRIGGNYVIPEGWEYSISRSTLLQDNFTAAGPWSPARVPAAGAAAT